VGVNCGKQKPSPSSPTGVHGVLDEGREGELGELPGSDVYGGRFKRPEMPVCRTGPCLHSEYEGRRNAMSVSIHDTRDVERGD
jgi:hypothetical protein